MLCNLLFEGFQMNVTVHLVTLFLEWEFTLLVFGQKFAVSLTVQHLPFRMELEVFNWNYTSVN